jgi:hypothetical protein
MTNGMKAAIAIKTRRRERKLRGKPTPVAGASQQTVKEIAPKIGGAAAGDMDFWIDATAGGEPR